MGFVKPMPDEPSMGIPANFLALPQQLSSPETSRVVLIPVPYDATTSYRPGARDGPQAIIRASHQLEDYDLELGYEPSRAGIYTSPELPIHVGSPEGMVERVQQAVSGHLEQHNRVGLLGGEHTITIGGVRSAHKMYPDLSVLYLDAHADLREKYQGSRFSHASVARRLLETCSVVEVGVRVLSGEEQEFLGKGNGPTIFYYRGPGTLEPDVIIKQLSPNVYVSVDLDVLDPSLMAAVGTPVPGGMGWHELLTLLRRVSEHRHLVGFDVTELSPGEGPEACAYTAAQLVYKLAAYSTMK